jgi:hypothetical protein
MAYIRPIAPYDVEIAGLPSQFSPKRPHLVQDLLHAIRLFAHHRDQVSHIVVFRVVIQQVQRCPTQ